MAMEVSTSTQASVEEEDWGMVTFSFALKKVSIFPKHDVKSMVQCVASQLVLIAWGVLIVISERTRACPQVPK